MQTGSCGWIRETNSAFISTSITHHLPKTKSQTGMLSSDPSSKCHRTEADTAESNATSLVIRSAQFWFDDGNVVLQGSATQFRVHRSVLSYHSPIMNDCFQSAQPQDEPTIEGCPLIHLQDSEKDISNMCSLLYGMYQCVHFSRPFDVRAYLLSL